MKNKFIYVLIVLFSFFIYGDSAKAAEEGWYGTCYYEFNQTLNTPDDGTVMQDLAIDFYLDKIVVGTNDANGIRVVFGEKTLSRDKLTINNGDGVKIPTVVMFYNGGFDGFKTQQKNFLSQMVNSDGTINQKCPKLFIGYSKSGTDTDKSVFIGFKGMTDQSEPFANEKESYDVISVSGKLKLNSALDNSDVDKVKGQPCEKNINYKKGNVSQMIPIKYLLYESGKKELNDTIVKDGQKTTIVPNASTGNYSIILNPEDIDSVFATKENGELVCPQLYINNNCDKAADENIALIISTVEKKCDNLEEKEETTVDDVPDVSKEDYEIADRGENISVCDTAIGEKTQKIIKKIYNYIRWIVPTLIVIFSIIDFIKIVALGDEKTSSTAKKNIITRIILGFSIFLIPIVVNLLIDLSGVNNVVDPGGNLDIYGIASCILDLD